MSYNGQIKLMLGNCLEKMKELETNSVDSIVTDPPYGLSFMGKKWDYDVPSQEIWEECLRVLKPGGYLLAFAGSRTYHRMAVRIEDAGFEIRDQILWVYGQGFPKSMDISKKIDAKLGAEREVIGMGKSGKTRQILNAANTPNSFGGDFDITEPTTDEAKRWSGWGTALKPAHEPIVMARKPISEPTVADNVLKYGTGGINIDGCRIETDDNLGGGATNGSVLDIDGFDRPWMHNDEKMKEFQQKMQDKVEHAQNLGRFPANIIFDKEAGKVLDEQSGISKSSGGSGESSMGALGNTVYGKYKNDVKASNLGGIGDTGGASRFFYCPTPDDVSTEPIVMARKPISEPTVADNVLKYGTGGINIDGCRIETDETITNHSRSAESAISKGKYGDSSEQETHQTDGQQLGRFPANIIFDEEAGKVLDEQSGVSKSTKGNIRVASVSNQTPLLNSKEVQVNCEYDDMGGASRFFYCPKTSKSERNEGLDGFEERYVDTSREPGSAGGTNGWNRMAEKPIANFHPTVKPVALMSWLIRLVTQKGGTTLDPFMGSGTSGKAAIREGMNFIGMEMESEYFDIAEARINWERDNFGKIKPKTAKKQKVEKQEVGKNDFWG